MGGIPKDEDFRKALVDCELVDDGYSRPWFMWKRGIFSKTNIRERLDKGVMVQTDKGQPYPLKPQFRFEACLVMEDSWHEVIYNSWKNCDGNLLQKLQDIRETLLKWSCHVRKKRGAMAKNLEKRLKELISGQCDDTSMAKMLDIKIQLNWEMEKQEVYWE